MKLPFIKDYKISYFEVDQKAQLSLARVPELMQDLAVKHSDEVGYNLEYLINNNYAWIITSWHIKFNSFPKENNKISLATWHRKYEKIQAQRTFEMKSDKGDVLCYGESKWFLMNTAKRRPLRLPKDFLEKYGSADNDSRYSKPLIENESFELPSKDLYNVINEKTFNVTRRDIDTNGHTNNISYIIWAIDDIDDYIFDDMKVTDLKVKYKLECKKGDLVKGTYMRRKVGNSIELSSLFTSPDEDKIYCQVTTIWEN